jgi:hypothetical protein
MGVRQCWVLVSTGLVVARWKHDRHLFASSIVVFMVFVILYPSFPLCCLSPLLLPSSHEGLPLHLALDTCPLALWYFVINVKLWWHGPGLFHPCKCTGVRRDLVSCKTELALAECELAAAAPCSGVTIRVTVR